MTENHVPGFNDDDDATRPAVGVVIPCYNDEPAHLAAAVGSALAQDVPVSVIVVDDGSTNTATHEALLALPDYVTVIRRENGGPSAARNSGIKTLRTCYVLPLDADDWITSGFARKSAAVLEAGARIAYAAVSHDSDDFERLDELAPSVSFAQMIDSNLIGSASMFRRVDWEQVGGYDESLRIGSEDYEFWVRLLALGGTARRVEGEVFHHRVRPHSRSQDQLARFIEARKVTREAMARNTPLIAGPALDRVDQLLRDNAALRAENEWWWRHFGLVRHSARRVRGLVSLARLKVTRGS